MPRTNRTDFLRRMAEISERIRSEVQPFEDMSPNAVADRKARGLKDDLYFAVTYFPHECENDFAEFHEEMMQVVDQKNRIVAIFGSRGSAKTSLAGKIKRIKRSVYRLHRFVAVVGETEEQATERCGEIRAEFENNVRLRADFGDLTSLSPWEYHNFKLSNGVRYLALGWRSRVRGRRDMSKRFDDVWADDYEDSQAKYNVQLIEKKYKKLKEDFLAATNLIDYYFTYIGNYFSKLSVGQKLKDDAAVDCRTYLIDDNGRATWPSRYPRQKLDELRFTLGSISYDIEIRQIPRDEEQQLVKDSWFRDWKDKDLEREHFNIGFLDPSMRKGEHNDFKALVIVHATRKPLKYFTGRTWIRRASVQEMVEYIFHVYKSEKLNVLGIEANNIKEYLEPLIAAKASEVGWHPHIVWIDHTTNKESRMIQKTSLMERGILLFQKSNSDQNILIDQWKFLMQPGMKDDGPDAHSAAVDLANSYMMGASYEPVHRSNFSQSIGRLLRKGAW